MNWVYPAEVVKECIAQPSKVSLSDDLHFELLALKSPITIEEAGFKSLILDKNKLKLEQNVSNSSELTWRFVKAGEEEFLFSHPYFSY